MRVTSRTIHTAALLALPLVVAAFGLGLGSAALLLVVLALWRWALVLKDLNAVPAGAALRLETIGVSHFVEKVRWCMDRLGVDYVEEQNVGTLGAFFLGRTVPRLHIRTGIVMSSLGNSPDILRYLWGRYGTEPAGRAAFLEPTPQALELEGQLDRYGHMQQQWVYHHVLAHPGLALRAWGVADPRVPAWQRWLAPPLFPLLRMMIRRSFRLGPGRHEKTLQRIDAVLGPLEQRLADGRRYLLGGDECSYVDITLAALSGLWLLPANYGAGMADGARIDVTDFPAAAQAEIATWRQRYPRLVALMEGLYERDRIASPA